MVTFKYLTIPALKQPEKHLKEPKRRPREERGLDWLLRLELTWGAGNNDPALQKHNLLKESWEPGERLTNLLSLAPDLPSPHLDALPGLHPSLSD